MRPRIIWGHLLVGVRLRDVGGQEEQPQPPGKSLNVARDGLGPVRGVPIHDQTFQEANEHHLLPGSTGIGVSSHSFQYSL